MSARLALRFLILTASRSGTVRQAVWQEIDFKARIWSIPGVRMKTGADHVVPLADAAIVCLREAEALRSRHSDLIFPSPVRRGRAMSDMTLTQVLRKVKLDDVPIAQRAVVHGFRTSFRVWASEQTNADHAVMELSLGHAVGAKVERAYARSDLLAKRRRLLDQWAAFATGITVDADVVPLRA